MSALRRVTTLAHPGRHEGMVLLFALLCLLALEVAAAGLHFVATQEIRTAQAVAGDADLQLAARSAAASAVASWPAHALDSLPVSGRLSLPVPLGSSRGIAAAAVIERVADHLFLVRGTATSPFLATASIGVVVATATPDALATGITGAVRSTGTVRVGAGSRIAHGSAGCAATGNAVEVKTDEAFVAVGGGVTGEVVVRDSIELVVDRISTLTRAHLARIAATAGPSGPGTVAFEGSGATLQMEHGTGILIVEGDLVIRGGRYSGILLVRGSVTLSEGANVNGALLVDGGSVVLDGATLTYDACTIRTVLSEPRLLGPFRRPGRLWIPLF